MAANPNEPESRGNPWVAALHSDVERAAYSLPGCSPPAVTLPPPGEGQIVMTWSGGLPARAA